MEEKRGIAVELSMERDLSDSGAERAARIG